MTSHEFSRLFGYGVLARVMPCVLAGEYLQEQRIGKMTRIDENVNELRNQLGHHTWRAILLTGVPALTGRRAGRWVSARLKGTPPRAKTDFYLHGAQISTINRSCLLPLPMMLLTQNFDAASPVTQINQGRACDLGRELQVKSKIRSPHSTHNLKILQCNINGLTSSATRIKLDHLLEIALKQDVKVIAVQETKLKEITALKVKGFNIFRVDRKSKSGGGLALGLVRDINYQKIEYPTDWSDLEVQGIRIQWRGKTLDIINVYHPPNHKPLPPALSNLLNKNSIIVGDLNAKHPSWGCSCSNARGEELLQLLDDTESMILNDGTHTFTSYSYNTSAALDIAITSSELFPQCSWRVLDTIGSDHFPVLICFKRRQKVFPDDKAAANGLAVYYQEISKLVFTSEDKSVMKRAKNIIHGCRTSDVGDQGLSGTSHSKNFC
ncbi:hypothetical protein TNCV_4108701 [Trichonephila clavipes]|nr:hypothetical protein TNCV_4108701 [Trichonephila clavipes]